MAACIWRGERSDRGRTLRPTYFLPPRRTYVFSLGPAARIGTGHRVAGQLEVRPEAPFDRLKTLLEQEVCIAAARKCVQLCSSNSKSFPSALAC